MSMQEWICYFLQKQGLEDGLPDGRPLYAYRLDQAGYRQLQQVLELTPYRDPERPLRRKWAQEFVLFASEWWRREYAGGHWTWSPILNEIGISDDELSPMQRNDIVELGLRCWKRESSIHQGGKKYIAAIAMEGGFPQRLLGMEGAKHRELLKRVIEALPVRRAWGETGADLVKQVAPQVYFPESFCKEEVYFVLGRIAEVSVDLIHKHDLANHSAPQDWLDAQEPQWREQFPLNLDDENATALLNGLIEAASVSVEVGVFDCQVRRYLEKGPSGWTLKAYLDVPKRGVSEEVLGNFLKEKELPARLNFYLNDGDQLHQVARLKRMSGKSEYRISRYSIDLKGDRAAGNLTLQVESGDRTQQFKSDVSGGQALEEGLPWVFDAQGSNASGHSFLGQGRVHIKAEACLVVLSKEMVSGDLDGSFEFSGALLEPERDLSLLSGSAGILVDGDRFWIRTRKDSSNAAEYHFRGNPVPWPSQPQHLFFGCPDVMQTEVGEFPTALGQDDLVWRWFGCREGWRKNQPFPVAGTIEVGSIDRESGELLFRKKLGLLPNKSRINLLPGDDPTVGQIRLDGFSQIQTMVTAKGVQTRIELEGADAVWSLICHSGQPPTDVVLEMQAGEANQTLSILLPFPAQGACWYSEGAPLAPGTPVFFERLHGVHAQLFAVPGRYPARIVVDAFLEEGRGVRFYFDRGSLEESDTIRLVQYREDIERLFSATDNIDAVVRLEILGNGSRWEVITIRNHECRLSNNIAAGSVDLTTAALARLSPDRLENMKLSALRLSNPEEEPVILEAVCSEGIPTGRWQFMPEKRQPGSWLIFPAPDSEVKCRPTVWDNQNIQTETTLGTLRSACDVPSAYNRAIAYDQQIERMCEDPFDDGWLFVEHTLRRFGHLRLSSHDLFRRLVRHPDAMAAMYMRLEFNRWQRFADELPFMWERVPLISWRKAVGFLKEKVRKTGGSPDLVVILLKDKLEKLVHLAPSLEFGLEYLKKFEEVSQQSLPKSPDCFTRFLQEDRHSEVQSLKRDVVEKWWPALSPYQLEEWREQLPSWCEGLVALAQHHCYGKEPGFRRSVIFLPIVMGAEWVTGESIISLQGGQGDHYRMFELHRIIHFHEDWFEAAMNWTIGYGMAMQSQQEGV